MSDKVLTGSVDVLVEQANRFRDTQEGVAVDSPETRRPEGIMAATRHSARYFDFAATVIDHSILDPELRSVRRFVDQLKAGKNAEPVLPFERGNFHFGGQRSMPGITLSGNYSTLRGFNDFKLRQTKSRPELYAASDPTLRSNSLYLACAQLACAIRRNELRCGSQLPEKVHPHVVTEVFSHLTSIGIAELASQGRMPLLLHASRAVVRLANGKVLSPIYVTPNTVPLLPYQQHETKDLLGSNTRKLKSRQAFNLGFARFYLENGASFLELPEMQLLADWFNRRQWAKIEQKNGSAIIDVTVPNDVSS